MTIIKKFEPELEKRTYPKKYIAAVGACFFVLMLAKIWASNYVVEYGKKLQELFQLKESLTMENQILENEIAASLSLKTITSKSAELGFKASESIQYIR